ncbi:MAG: hypothetical protein QXY62_02045 [Candidatus Altiarchaeota archaeon]
MKRIAPFCVILFLSNYCFAITEEGSLYEKFILERGIKKGIVEKFFIETIKALKILFEHNLRSLIERNPDVSHPSIQVVVKSMINVLEPICVLALLVSAFYLIFLSGTPWERATAKALIPNLIFAIIALPFSSYILFVLFSLSESLTKEIFMLSSADPLVMFTSSANYLIEKFSLLNELSSIASIPFIFLIMLSLLLPLLIFAIRYLLLSIFSAIFPITLFLYLFIPTRFLGRRFMELTFSLLFIQIVGAISLIAISALLLTFGKIPYELKFISEIAASLTLALITIGTITVLKDYLPE